MLLECTKNFVMEEGDISFIKGTVYDFYDNGDGIYIAKDEQGDKHEMWVALLINYFYAINEEY